MQERGIRSMRQLLFAISACLFLARCGLQLFADRRAAKRQVSIPLGGVPSEDLLATLWGVCATLAVLRAISSEAAPAFCILGCLLVCLGSSLGLIGVFTLGHNYARRIGIYQEQVLVTDGIYSVVRHPIRLGIIVEVMGFACFMGSGVGILAVVAMWLSLGQRSDREDVLLKKYFGTMALNYQKRVPGLNIVLGVYRKVVRRIKLSSRLAIRETVIGAPAVPNYPFREGSGGRRAGTVGWRGPGEAELGGRAECAGPHELDCQQDREGAFGAGRSVRAEPDLAQRR